MGLFYRLDTLGPFGRHFLHTRMRFAELFIANEWLKSCSSFWLPTWYTKHAYKIPASLRNMGKLTAVLEWKLNWGASDFHLPITSSILNRSNLNFGSIPLSLISIDCLNLAAIGRPPTLSLFADFACSSRGKILNNFVSAGSSGQVLQWGPLS